MNADGMTDRLLYTTAEAARLLSVTESWLKRGATAHVLPHTRLGARGLVRWSEQDLAEIVTAGQTPPVVLDQHLRPVRGAA